MELYGLVLYNQKSFLGVYCIWTGTEDTNPRRGMLITLELVSQTKAQQSCLKKTIVIHFVAVGCWYIVVLCPQVGCCDDVVHVEITVIILKHMNKREHLIMYKQLYYYKHWHINSSLHRIFLHSILVVYEYMHQTHIIGHCTFYLCIFLMQLIILWYFCVKHE